MIIHISCINPYSHNVNHLILVASKFGNFKRLTYLPNLILAVSPFNVL